MVSNLFEKDIIFIKNEIVNYLQKVYPQKDIKIDNLILLNKGRFANATVFEYKSEDLNLTIKDFSGSPWLIKNTLGKLFVDWEFNNLQKLKENPSIAKNSKKISNYTLVFDYIEGKPLKSFPENSLNKEFFLELENNIKLMHQFDLVHLDLRNLGNVLVGDDGHPYIIDFQSAISTKYIFSWLEKILKTSDLTGAYKCWKYKCNEPLDTTRSKTLEDFNKLRKIWIFKGYPLSKTIKKLKTNFNLNKAS